MFSLKELQVFVEPFVIDISFALVYKKYANAQKVIKSMNNSGITNANIIEKNNTYKILIGPYQNKQSADKMIEKLEEIGIFDYFFVRR